jgi:uncharacterized membrane protein
MICLWWALRALAVLGGAGLLAVAAHVTISYSGGYGKWPAIEPHAIQVMALALGVALGAICIGVAWSQGRWVVAICIAFSLLAGEVYGVVRTIERVMSARGDAQAQIEAADQARKKARDRVTEAEAAVAALVGASPRLSAALRAQQAANDEIAEKAALRGCASNCRKLLQAKADVAVAEVAAARAAIARERNAAQAELDAARAALAAIPALRPATPLAKALGWSPWSIDLIVAVLASIGSNGLGAALLAFGAHAPSRRRVVQIEAQAEPAVSVEGGKLQSRQPVGDEHKHIAGFAAARLCPDDTAHATLADLLSAYRAYCDEQRIDPLHPQRAGELFAELVKHLGLDIENHEGEPVILGLRVDRPALKLIESQRAA